MFVRKNLFILFMKFSLNENYFFNYFEHFDDIGDINHCITDRYQSFKMIIKKQHFKIIKYIDFEMLLVWFGLLFDDLVLDNLIINYHLFVVDGFFFTIPNYSMLNIELWQNFAVGGGSDGDDE